MIILNETEKNENVDEISLEEILADQAGFDFASQANDVLRDGRIPTENCVLEKGSLDELRRRLGPAESWKKTYLCGKVRPEAYSLEAAAKAYGYDELDAGAAPEGRDEEEYLADRQAWYDRIVDNALWEGMPEKAFGAELKAKPFLLRATRPDGEGVGLACRIVQFW